MLIKCPECELQVSDKAISCPHCGFPLKTQTTPSKRKPKHMRLPNGFGSITEIKNRNLRKPFYARVCVGRTETNSLIYKSLKPQSLFETYQDAYAALIEYNRNPYDLEPDITVEQLYEKWTDYYFDTINESYKRTVTSAWQYCSSIYRMRAKDVRGRHIKGCMTEGYRIETKGKRKGEKVYPSAGTKSRIKSMFNLMFDYALEYEIVDKNYARTFEVSEDIIEEQTKAKRGHIIFTEEELKIMWGNVDKVKYVDWILIQCYMGWRPQELAILNLTDVDLEHNTITGGMKTDAGKQRVIPIHSKIMALVQRNYDFALEIGSDKLFNDKGQTHAGKWALTYDKYAKRFNKVMKELDFDCNHRPHDPRKTFVTRAKKASIDDNAIKAIVGHKTQDITESAYTDRDIEWLRKDIEKLD